MSRCAPDRTGQRWTRDEDAELVRAAFTRATWKNLAGRLGRSEASVESRARNLRASGAHIPLKSRSHERRTPWTDSQRELVKAGLEAGDSIEVIARATGRSVESVRAEVWRQVGGRAYKRRHPNAIRVLAKRAIEMSKQGVALPEIADKFDVSVETMRRWCRRYGHDPSQRSRRAFTLADDDRIRRGYAKGEHPKQIAADLGRTLASVRVRARKLGLTKIRRTLPKPWTNAELARAVALRDAGESYKAIGAELGRSYASVKSAIDAHRRRQ